LDHTRVVLLVRKLEQLTLIKPYLQAVQEKDNQAVNEALNELYIGEKDHVSLRSSIERFSNFEATKLAKELEVHKEVEFRRIAALIYQRIGKYSESIALSKTDELWDDAIETASVSKKPEVSEELLKFFVDQGLNESFSATLIACYDQLRPDVVLETAWKRKITDFAFPYLIKVMKDYTNKVDTLVKAEEKRQKEQEKRKEEPNTFVPEEMMINQIPQLAYYPANFPDPSAVPGFQGGQAFTGIPSQNQFGFGNFQ